MSEQMRECPFCGKATAHALIAKEQMPGYRAWKLSVRGECTNQGCRTLGPQYSLIVPQDIDPPYKTEEWHAVIDQAIAAWNQRAGEAEKEESLWDKMVREVGEATSLQTENARLRAELAPLRALREAVIAAKQSLVSAMLEGPVESGMVSDHQRRLSAALNAYDETIKDTENE